MGYSKWSEIKHKSDDPVRKQLKSLIAEFGERRVSDTLEDIIQFEVEPQRLEYLKELEEDR